MLEYVDLAFLLIKTVDPILLFIYPDKEISHYIPIHITDELKHQNSYHGASYQLTRKWYVKL